MKINRNMSAVTANTQLLRVEERLAASVQRLSSGYKLNKPGDNPAGMAISNKMKAQIRALDQASDNVSDGVSVMQIADGALSEVTSCLQRMRELAVQANNGVYSREDKQSLQDEIDQLRQEVDRISSTTEFNTKTLLDGSSDVRSYSSIEGTDATGADVTMNDVISRIRVSDTVAAGTYKVNVEAAAEQATMTTGLGTVPSASGTLTVNGVSLAIDSSWDQQTYESKMTDLLDEAGCTMDWTSGKITSTRYGQDAEINVTMSADLATATVFTGTTDASTGDVSASATGKDAKVTLLSDTTESNLSTSASVTADGNRVTIKDFDGFSIEFQLDADLPITGELAIEVTDIGAMTVQSGANQFQTMDLTIPAVSSEALYLDEIDVTVAGGAGRALSTLDDAITRLNEVRSGIGAFQNRLESARDSLDESEENMTSAYSTLADTDMATEMVEYTQQNVLQQAATSVLAQANELPDTVLSLLSR